MVEDSWARGHGLGVKLREEELQVRATLLWSKWKKWSYEPLLPLQTSSRSSAICLPSLPACQPACHIARTPSSPPFELIQASKIKLAAAAALPSREPNGRRGSDTSSAPFIFLFIPRDVVWDGCDCWSKQHPARLQCRPTLPMEGARQPDGHLRCSFVDCCSTANVRWRTLG
jgi:hypothetical protein